LLSKAARLAIVALNEWSLQSLRLNVSAILRVDVAWRVVFANTILGSSGETREDLGSVAGNESTTQLSRTLPDNLSEVRSLRVARVIRADFVHPHLNGLVGCHTARLRRQVLSIHATTVMKVAAASPALRSVGKIVAPGQRRGAMFGPVGVVGVEPLLSKVIRSAVVVVVVIVGGFRRGVWASWGGLRGGLRFLRGLDVGRGGGLGPNAALADVVMV